ncbi:hypothetical protein J4465_00810 [Candidatus Pacearchaeota archaeon]|nr:hypothetical protein [Candidatus Pacearchaeota archaeon]
MEEQKTFYQQAEEFYDLALRAEDFFKQRIPLMKCVELLYKAYNYGQIGSIELLPKDPLTISHADKKETSDLLKILHDDFFLLEEDFPEIIRQEHSYQC